MSTLKQTLKNTATGWLSVIIGSILSVITIPFLLAAVGIDGLGLIAILGTIVGLSSVIDLGLRGALGQTLSEQVALKNNKAFSQIISTALLLYILISFVFALVVYFSAPSLTVILSIPDDLRPTAISLIRLYGTLAVLISFLTPVFSAALHSHHRFDIANTIQVLRSILANGVILAMIYFSNFEIIDWVIITLLFQALSLILLVIAFKKQCKEIIISTKLINFTRLKPLFSLGGYMYLIQLSGTISNQSNPLIVSSFAGVSSVGIYQPALKISEAFTPVVMTLTSQLYPSVTKHHIAGNKDGINKIFLLGSKYTLLLGSLASAGVFFFAEPFAKIWLSNSIGEDYLIVASLMQLFVIVDILSYTSGTQWPILLGMKKLKYLTRLLLSTAVLDILLSIYFVGYMGFGVAGVLYGTIISKLIRVYLLNRYVLKLLNVRFTEYLRVSISSPLLCLVLTGITAWAIVGYFDCNSWFDLIFMSGATFLAWLIFTWFLCLNQQERKIISTGNFKSLTV